jgi:hypothetical protein
MKFEKELNTLVEAGVLDPETKDRIQKYYDSQPDHSRSRLLLAFGVLGAVLIGLGIILLVAHNWDSFSKPVRTLFAAFPLIVSQCICLWAILKKEGIPQWLEPGSTLVVFSLGACISLVGQIYHIPGDLDSFLLAWMAGSLPLVYILPASVPSLLILLGSTVYALLGLSGNGEESPHLYWVFFASLLPYYIRLIIRHPDQLLTTFHHVFISISLGLSFSIVLDKEESLMPPAYVVLGGLFLIWGNQNQISPGTTGRRIFSGLGSLIILVILLAFTYDGSWDLLMRQPVPFKRFFNCREGLVSTTMFLFLSLMFLKDFSGWMRNGFLPVLAGSILFLPVFIVGQYASGMVVVMNVLVLGIAMWTLWAGAKSGNAGKMNLGLGLASVLIGLRFLDSDLSFEIRGLLFIALGIGFFLANYFWIGKQKKNV